MCVCACKACLRHLHSTAHLHLKIPGLTILDVWLKTCCVPDVDHLITEANKQTDSFRLCFSVWCSHPAVFVVIKYLWGERVPCGGSCILWDILSHPLPVGLVGRDVTLLKFDLIGCQETHHILLLLFDLWRRGAREDDREEVVSYTHSNFKITRKQTVPHNAISLLRK